MYTKLTPPQASGQDQRVDEFQLASALPRDQNLVTRGDAGLDTLSLLVESTGADGQDLGLVQLLHGALGEEDASGSLSLGLYALDQDAVEEGSNGADRLDGRLHATMDGQLMLTLVRPQALPRIHRTPPARVAKRITYHCDRLKGCSLMERKSGYLEKQMGGCEGVCLQGERCFSCGPREEKRKG